MRDRPENRARGTERRAGLGRGARLLTTALLASLLLTQGCFVALMLETDGDMERRLDAIELPPDWEPIARRFGGSRIPIDVQYPYVEREYSAPWKDRELCSEVEALARSLGTLNVSPPSSANVNDATTCTYATTIGSGWRARVVGVWSYGLRIQARSREAVFQRSPFLTEAWCEAHRDSMSKHPHDHALYLQDARCFVPPGHALIRIEMGGSQL